MNRGEVHQPPGAWPLFSRSQTTTGRAVRSNEPVQVDEAVEQLNQSGVVEVDGDEEGHDEVKLNVKPIKEIKLSEPSSNKNQLKLNPPKQTTTATKKRTEI